MAGDDEEFLTGEQVVEFAESQQLIEERRRKVYDDLIQIVRGLRAPGVRFHDLSPTLSPETVSKCLSAVLTGCKDDGALAAFIAVVAGDKFEYMQKRFDERHRELQAEYDALAAKLVENLGDKN